MVSLLIEIMGKMSAKPMGSRGGGRQHTDLNSEFKRKGELRRNERKKSNGIVLRIFTRGFRLLVSPDAQQNVLQF